MNNNNFPTIITSDHERELQAFEFSNSRPSQYGTPAIPINTTPNLSPDFLEFSNTQETTIQQELYNLQERSISSIRTRLCDLRDKLNSTKTSLNSKLIQVDEQLREVDKQLAALSRSDS